MKVTVSAEVGNGASIAVTVEDQDMAAEFDDYDGWLPAKRYKQMSAKADIFCLDFLRKKGTISDEFFADRVAAIRAGLQ